MVNIHLYHGTGKNQLLTAVNNPYFNITNKIKDISSVVRKVFSDILFLLAFRQ